MDISDKRKIAVLFSALSNCRGVIGELVRGRVADMPEIIPRMQHIDKVTAQPTLEKVLGHAACREIAAIAMDDDLLSEDEKMVLRGSDGKF